jgi:hypothetical protein
LLLIEVVLLGKTIEEIAHVAAKWWANQLKNPKFDDGDPSVNGFNLRRMLDDHVQSVSDGQCELFIASLSKIIIDEVKELNGTVLKVDYVPYSNLKAAADAANIPYTNFPIKTKMEVDANHIFVRLGYGEKQEILYVNKEYFNKEIENRKRLIDKYPELQKDMESEIERLSFEMSKAEN